MANKNVGRPTVISSEVVSILVSSFQTGMNVREACWQSGISHEAYYSRLREDEQFADTIAKAQASSTLVARKVVLEAINGGDVSAAKWWLERKAPEEFGRNIKSEQQEQKEVKANPFLAMSDAEMDNLAEELYSILSTESFNGKS